MIVIWHHRDLRLDNNPAVKYAAERANQVLPIYIHDHLGEEAWSAGGASRWWLHKSLEALSANYREAGTHLAIRRGDSWEVLLELCSNFPITEVCWMQRSEPALRQRDREVQLKLQAKGLKVSIGAGNYLVNPKTVLNKSSEPYKVFTPFYKALLKELEIKSPDAAPAIPPITLGSEVHLGKVEDLDLLSGFPWQSKLNGFWEPGRQGALKNLSRMENECIKDYATTRDLPYNEGTSKLSPHLAFGEISPQEIWYRLKDNRYGEPFLRQLAWREFANYFLFHFPDSVDSSWRQEFEAFPWKKDRQALETWQAGMTGYPIVDAGMRELWQTGWMHNRVRMIVASFLCKDLLIHWRHGARWFWDTLVDADLGNNSLGWQWTAGSGPDAAPYFRVFNPVLQGKKFDPDGKYIRQFIPELADLPSKYIHCPWDAPESVCRESGLIIGEDYPLPMIDHGEARKRALACYKELRS